MLARLILAFLLSLIVFTVGTVLVWVFENGHQGGDIHGVGDAAFFAAGQLLTVSSGAKNPLTTPGKVVDIALELWAIFVVTAVAGSFASFFAAGDKNWDPMCDGPRPKPGPVVPSRAAYHASTY